MTDEESLHLRYYRKMITQLWLLVTVSVLLAVLVSVSLCRMLAASDIDRLERFIESRLQTLSTVSANGNTVHVSPNRVDEFVERALIKKGKIDATGLPGPNQPERRDTGS